MRHSLPLAPQFYVTAPQPCPYLEGRMERKLFTALQGDNADKLNDAPTRHWTGSDQQISGWVRVDGKALRFMGGGRGDTMTQVSRELTPTRTSYDFDGGGVRLTATFLSPALPDDLDLVSAGLGRAQLERGAELPGHRGHDGDGGQQENREARIEPPRGPPHRGHRDEMAHRCDEQGADRGVDGAAVRGHPAQRVAHLGPGVVAGGEPLETRD